MLFFDQAVLPQGLHRRREHKSWYLSSANKGMVDETRTQTTPHPTATRLILLESACRLDLE
jgi:hypothetical protein